MGGGSWDEVTRLTKQCVGGDVTNNTDEVLNEQKTIRMKLLKKEEIPGPSHNVCHPQIINNLVTKHKNLVSSTYFDLILNCSINSSVI